MMHCVDSSSTTAHPIELTSKSLQKQSLRPVVKSAAPFAAHGSVRHTPPRRKPVVNVSSSFFAAAWLDDSSRHFSDRTSMSRVTSLSGDNCGASRFAGKCVLSNVVIDSKMRRRTQVPVANRVRRETLTKVN
jgi:hypothetical protein